MMLSVNSEMLRFELSEFVEYDVSNDFHIRVRGSCCTLATKVGEMDPLLDRRSHHDLCLESIRQDCTSLLRL